MRILFFLLISTSSAFAQSSSFFHTLLAQPAQFSFGASDSIPATESFMSEITTSSVHLYNPQAFWKDGKTYLFYQSTYQVRPFGQIRMMVYDENFGFDRPYKVGYVLSGADTHTVPSSAFPANDTIYVGQENLHNTPVDLYKSTNLDGSLWEKLAEVIGTDLAYINFIEQEDGNYMTFSRGGGVEFSIYLTEATNEMEDWGTQLRISTVTAGQRHYPTLPMNSAGVFANKNYLVVTNRNDTGFNWFRSSLMFFNHSDLTKFWNYDSTYVHDIDTDGLINDSDLSTYFKYYETSASNVHGGVAVTGVSPTGEFYAVHTSEDTDYYFVYWDGAAWDTREIAIANLYRGTVDQAGPFLYCVPHSDDNIELWARIDNGTYRKIHRFKTTNKGLTWEDLGDIAPDVNDDIWGCLIPANMKDIPNNRNFGVWLVSDRMNDTPDVYAAVHVVRAAKGVVQAESGAITPASDLSHASLERHYKPIDANITRSGNNISAMTDLSGNGHNATGVGNPQWNGSDAATTNGTSSYFTVPTTGLTTLSKGTFIAVSKSTSVNSTLLSFADNSSTTEHTFFNHNITAYDAATYGYRNGGSNYIYEYGDDQTDDNAYHIIVIQVDGEKKADIYVDGVKQVYTNNSTTLAEGLLVGKFNDSITTINSCRIGSIDRSTTDLFYATDFKEMAFYSEFLDFQTVQEFTEKLADDYSITLGQRYR